MVHRVALSSALALTGYDPGTDKVLTALFKRFHLDRPRKQRVVPKWDLAVVLGSFLKKNLSFWGPSKG